MGCALCLRVPVIAITSSRRTVRAGMPQRMLCVRLWKGRGASRAVFPRRTWDRFGMGLTMVHLQSH